MSLILLITRDIALIIKIIDMKKILTASTVAILAFAVVASAATFSANLTVGSKGADVTALQTALIAGGYSIPAGATGYFGSQTKAAVMKYQAANGVPATGFVGPLTRAALNGGVAVAPATGCPAGYTCTLTGAQGGTVIGNTGTTGTDGSVSVSQSSYVSTGATLKKGDTKNVVAVKLQATAGSVTVSRFDAHFSVRPWLYFSQVTLTDSNGKVLATKSVASPSDATEITVGSDYLVRFEGLNYVVTPGVNPDLAVGVSVLSATDKIPGGGTSVNVGVPTGAIRTVNGLGITDSVGGVAFGSAGVGASTFSLSSSGSVADISTRLSPASSATTRSQVVSGTVTTNDVVLAVYSVKAANNSATINSLNFTIQTDPAFTETGLFSNIRIKDGSTTYGALSFSTAGLAVFNNLNIPLVQDQWKDLTLVADIAATSTNVSASSTLVANTLNAIDATYTSATVGGVAMGSATNDQTGANVLLTINSMSASGMSAVAGAGITDVANGPVVRYPVSYTFTLTNNSNNSLYVPADVSAFVGTSTSPTNASSTITLINPMTPVAGDTATTYIIPSGGGSRTFTVGGVIKKSSNASSADSLRISSIVYGTSQSTGTGASITTGLENLFKLVNF